MTRLALTIAAAVFPCAAQASDAAWPLALVDGVAPGYAATLSLDQPGQIHGRAPCNRYSASLTGSLPGFSLGSVMATRMACADIAAEQRFFDLLSRMDHAEQTDSTLTLTGGGHRMVFFSQP